ncbi:MAG: YciI family protein [Gammaproteobacteria bacterium]|nr:YciI family protein [Gammaproteobacteria bacterium]
MFDPVHLEISNIYKKDSGRVLATLMRLLGDLDLAEETMQFFVYFTMGENTPMNPPSPEGMAKMGKFMQKSFESGKIVATGKLPKDVTYVTLEKGNFSISDGPFIEGKELIPGFTVISADSKQEALEWVQELRECMGDGTIKMAQLMGTSAEDMKPPK